MFSVGKAWRRASAASPAAVCCCWKPARISRRTHIRRVLTNANIVAGSPAYDWGYHTDDAPRLGHNIAVPQGRVIGGSSAVDAAVAMRARPANFARWAKRGIEGWSWDEARDH